MFCPRCGNESRDEYHYCMHCGLNLREVRSPQYPYPPYRPQPGIYPIPDRKDPDIATILALLPGLIGIMGIGHLYVGKMMPGLLFLLLGIILGSLAVGTAFLGFMTMGAGFILTAIILVVYLIILIFQTLEANKLAKHYNDQVVRYGRAPW